MIHTFGIARIQHADTGEIYEIDKDLINFERTDPNEYNDTVLLYDNNIMIESSAILQHPQLGRLTWRIWEYPIRLQHDDGTNVGPHKVLENFKFEVELDEDIAKYDKNRRRVNYLVEWFKENYEDPAESVTYVSREGGYQWQNGGPCDASDELHENFPNEIYDIIEAAVEEIESEGIAEWSPIQHPRDFDTKDMFPDYDLKDINEKLNTLIDNAPESTTDPAFAFGEDNLLHIIDPPDNQPVDSQDELLDELRMVIDDLSGFFAGHNIYPKFIPIIERYKEAISGDQISITRLYARGIRLENMAQATNQAIESGEPSLSPDTKECLTTAIKLHDTYIMSNPEGQRLVGASVAYHRTPEQTEVLKTAVEQFAISIMKTQDLFGTDVQENFSDLSRDIASGQYHERLNQINVNKITNLFSSILRWMKSPKGTITSVILGGSVATSIPGKMAMKAGANLIDKIWGFLTSSTPSVKVIANFFSTQSPWLVELSQVLERIISMIGL